MWMLENLKIKLVKIVKKAEEYNLCLEGAGSFSIRDENSGYIIITPSKMKIDDLAIDHICILDIEGNIINALDGIEPDSDSFLHLELYKAKKEIRAIMHINPIFATAFSVINKVIPPITYDSANYGGYIYSVSNDSTSNVELAKDLIEKLKTTDACLLEGNGTIVISKDIENIVSKGRVVEKTAEVYYRALILNQFKEPKRFNGEKLKLYQDKQKNIHL